MKQENIHVSKSNSCNSSWEYKRFQLENTKFVKQSRNKDKGIIYLHVLLSFPLKSQGNVATDQC